MRPIKWLIAENVSNHLFALICMSHLISVPISAITALSAERAVELLTAVLHAEAGYARLSPATITISKRLTVADGGIDAEINPPSEAQIPTDCFFTAELTGIQLKSGASFKPWTESSIRGELINSAGALFAEVQRLVDRRGRYLVVCTGHDLTPQQRNDSRECIARVLSSVGVADYDGLIEVLGASQVAAFAERYPGTAALLILDVIQEAWVLDEWDRDAHMANAFLPASAQAELIQQIRAGIEGDAHHIRVLGEPGLGKTRMVLEALRVPQIAPSVLYLRHGSKFGQTTLFRQLLKVRWSTPLVIVLDDLPEAEMSDIWRHLKTRCGAIRLVTLDHGHDEGSDEGILRLEAPRLPDETIRTILASRIGESRELDRWVPICEGSPRVAHAVAENLQANPEDLLRAPATVPLWTRFLHGYGAQDDGASRQLECVAHHLALFSRFGYEDPVAEEAEYICELVQKVDPTIGWARFQEIVQELRARRVLQGSRTLFFVPKALHIHLWKQFWSKYGRGFDFVQTFQTMPPSLHAWFLNKFRFASGREAASVIYDILKPEGIFFDRSVLTSATGSRFLSTLAEASPSAVLRLLEATVAKWSDEDLAAFKSDRQNFVWTLEKLAVWPQYTVRALSVLARLAVNENATNSNNATGTFVDLFRIGPEVAATEASPGNRLPALLPLLRGHSEAGRLLALKALAAALDTHGLGYRTVGPEYQGLKQRAKLWVPETYDAWWQAHFLYFTTLIEETASWPGNLRSQVCAVLLDAVGHQVRVPPCTELAFNTLEALTVDVAMSASKLNQFFWHWQEYKEDDQHQEIATRLRRLSRQFIRRDLVSRVQRYVVDVEWLDWEEDYRERNGQPPSHAKALVRAIARRVAAAPDRLDEILGLLTPSVQSPAVGYFGEQLAMCDTEAALLNPLAQAAERGLHGACLHGYLMGLKARETARYEAWMATMLCTRATAKLGAEMALRGQHRDEVFGRCLDALEAGWIDPGLFGALRFGRAIETIPPQQLERLARLLIERDSSETLQLLIGLLDSIPADHPAPCSSESIFSTLSRTMPGERDRGQFQGYTWKRVASRFVKSDPSYAIWLLDSILTAMGEQYRLSYDQYVASLARELAKEDPEAAWLAISKQFEATLPKWRSDLCNWLKGGIHAFDAAAPSGAISDLPEESILAWIERDPGARAALIAHAALATLDPEFGGRLTQALLERFGEIDGVRSGISAAFHSGAWSGPASQHYKKQRETLRRWLGLGLEYPVTQWIELEIEQLDRQIDREEIQEERDRFDG